MSERVSSVDRERPVITLERGLPSFECMKGKAAVVECGRVPGVAGNGSVEQSQRLLGLIGLARNDPEPQQRLDLARLDLEISS